MGSGDQISFGFTCIPTRETVAALEAMPIDSLWVGGHVASRNPTSEPLVELARLSALSERVRIGTSILGLPLYPPALVAKQIADLDRASSGRVTLGIGVGGEYPQEFRACEVDMARRGSRTDEAIPLLRRLWSAETISHHGPNFDMDDVRIHPAPLQAGGPPIIVAGRQPVAMRRAALLGDGWMPYLYSARRYASSVDTIREKAAEAGRQLDGFQWMIFAFANVNDDASRARAEAAEFLGGSYNQDFEAMLDNVALVGTPAEVADKLSDFITAGARHFIFTPTSRQDPLRVAERLVHEVIPRLVRS